MEPLFRTEYYLERLDNDEIVIKSRLTKRTYIEEKLYEIDYKNALWELLNTL